MRGLAIGLGRLLIIALISAAAFGELEAAAPDPGRTDAYLFWRTGCPYCERAQSFLMKLQEEIPNLNVVGLEDAARYRGEMCFAADPDRQDVLPKGTPQQVHDHIRDVVAALKAPSGGLIGSLSITEDEPLENVEAICAALEKYRTYFS